jgi:hypothetical protein
MTRDDIVAEARRYLNVPYHRKGRSLQGLDCLGLLVMVGRHFEVPHIDEQDYSDWPHSDHVIIKKLGQYLTPMSPTLPMSQWPGLVGIFAERRLPGHAGIFSFLRDRVHLIHARVFPSAVMEECWDQVPHSEIRLIGLFAFPGMVD